MSARCWRSHCSIQTHRPGAAGCCRRAVDRPGIRQIPSSPARGPAYSILALALWLALHAGGVHATLAGVAVALVVPVFTPERQRVEAAVDVIRAFRQSPNSEYARAATRSLRESISINERLLTSFAPYVSFGILPFFALANAGVRLDAETLRQAVSSPLTWGVIVGLVVGKLVGITGATWLVQRLGMGRLAPGLTLRRVAGGAAVWDRLHHCAFHRRRGNRRRAVRGSGPGRCSRGIGHRVHGGMGDVPDHRSADTARAGGS